MEDLAMMTIALLMIGLWAAFAVSSHYEKSAEKRKQLKKLNETALEAAILENQIKAAETYGEKDRLRELLEPRQEKLIELANILDQSISIPTPSHSSPSQPTAKVFDFPQND